MKTFATSAEPDSGPLEYRRGWLLYEGSSIRPPQKWRAYPFGTSHQLAIHPSTRLARSSTLGFEIALLGSPIDIDANTSDPAEIARTIAEYLTLPSGRYKALKYVAYLGGRFACLYVDVNANELLAITDCAATMPIYWAESAAGEFIASTHASLCASATNKPIDTKARSLLKLAREMNTPGTLFPPGIMTGYEDVNQVLANHFVRVRGARKISHERYYPFPESSAAMAPEDAYEQFRDTFMRHVELISKLGTLGISLTGGRDSRATLAAAYPHLTPDSLTWTYANMANPHPEHAEDSQIASGLSRRLRTKHINVDLSQSNAPEIVNAHRKTMGASAQMPGVSWAYAEQLPRDMIELQSMVAEIGTGFYKNRRGNATVGRLAELYARGQFNSLPEVQVEIEKFIDYADFHEERFGELDFHDLFYWEHRLGRWGGRRIQEVDLAHTVVLPFNSRAIVESLRTRRIEDRSDKQDLVQFVADTMPALSD